MSINQNNFKEKLNEWILIEKKIDEMNKKIKLLRDQKDKKEELILKYMKDSNLENKIIKLNNQKISIGNDNTYTTLSYKYIEETLKKKYSESNVKEIIKYLKSEREKKINKILKKGNIKNTNRENNQ